MAPITDFAFLMRAFILASLLSSGVSKEPRYLKLFVNWMCWLSGRGVLGSGYCLSYSVFSLLLGFWRKTQPPSCI